MRARAATLNCLKLSLKSFDASGIAVYAKAFAKCRLDADDALAVSFETG